MALEAGTRLGPYESQPFPGAERRALRKSLVATGKRAIRGIYAVMGRKDIRVEDAIEESEADAKSA